MGIAGLGAFYSRSPFKANGFRGFGPLRTRLENYRLPKGGGKGARWFSQIVDPYLRFYYRFLANRQTQLALGVQDQTLAEIRRHLRDFIGANTWEQLCREWLLRASANNGLPVLVDQVGSAWTRTAQVDVVGINSMGKVLVLGECK